MNIQHFEEVQMHKDVYGNYFIQLNYELCQFTQNLVDITVNIINHGGGTEKLTGFSVDNTDPDYKIYYFDKYLLKNRIYFHRKFNNPDINIILVKLFYARNCKSNNHEANVISETFSLYDIIPLTKIINSHTIKYLNGQNFDKDIYPELYNYLGSDSLPNVTNKTFIKLNSSSNNFIINKTKFYRIFWGHEEYHAHTYYYTSIGIVNDSGSRSSGALKNNTQETPIVKMYHNLNVDHIATEGINGAHWEFNTGDACPQRIPLFFHMRVK